MPFVMWGKGSDGRVIEDMDLVIVFVVIDVVRLEEKVRNDLLIPLPCPGDSVTPQLRAKI